MTTKIALIGHPNVGKSSLASAILIKTFNADIKNLISEGNKKIHFLTDVDSDERERNMTLQTNVIDFQYNDKCYKISDCPGHLSLLKESIDALSWSNVVMLLISIKYNEFRSAFKSHFSQLISIVRCLGFKEILIVINKMDIYDFNKTRYYTIVNNLKMKLKKYKFNNIHFIPVSATDLSNITTKLDKNICTMSLFEALHIIEKRNEINSFITPNNKLVSGSFTFLNIDKLISIGFKAKIHTSDKSYDCEITQISNNKMAYLTNKNTKDKIISLVLKISTNDIINSRVILRNKNNTICIGILHKE